MDMTQPKNIIITLLVLVVLLGGAAALMNTNSRNTTPVNPPGSEDAKTPNQDAQASAIVSARAAATQEVTHVTIKTAKGDIKLALYPKVAPKTVQNFVTLAQKGFYNGLTFHRVVPGFVIQGGDPKGNGTGGPGYQFEDEINPTSLGLPDPLIKQNEARGYAYNYSLTSLPVDVGALAMANAGPNTNGSQFFIVTDAPQDHLNGLHTVFGKVLEGMDVVHKIQQGDKMTSVVVE